MDISGQLASVSHLVSAAIKKIKKFTKKGDKICV